MHAHDVALQKNCLEVDLDRIGCGARYGVGEQDPRAERRDPMRHSRADVAHPDDAHRHRAQLAPHRLFVAKGV